jgi:hypothetical protein
MGVTGLTLSGFLLLAAAGPSAAAENTSAYTKLDLDKCRAQPTDPDDPVQTGIWLCSGYAGIKVRAEEADLRFYVSYGARADQEPAAHQTVPAFNTIGETVEWRLDGKQRPIATILRFHTGSDDTSAGSTLVVTRLGPPGGVCHVGYVDAVDNPRANEIARAVADRVAGDFSCEKDEALSYGTDGEPIR